MKINASCVFDIESVKALNRLLMFRKNDPRKRMIFWGIIYAVLGFVMLLEMVAWGPDKILIIYLCVLIAVELLMCYWYFAVPVIQYKALAKLQGTVNMYCFEDDALAISSNGVAFNGNAELQYSAIVKCFETSKYFFVYQTKNQVYIVDKATVSGGTAEQIRNRLISFIGNKYIICKY